MRTLYSVEEQPMVGCPTMAGNGRTHNSDSTDSDDRMDDMDTTFQQFLNGAFFNSPAPPSKMHDDILGATSLWDATAADLHLGEPLLLMGQDPLMSAPDDTPVPTTDQQDDHMTTVDIADVLEAAAVNSIDLSTLYEAELKLEPPCAPSPDGSDSGVDGVDTSSFTLEYCDTPPVTPPQAAPASPDQHQQQQGLITQHPTTIIRLIKQELTPDLTPHAFCVSTPAPAPAPKLPIPALPRTVPRKPARPGRVPQQFNANAARVRPAPEIRPRPTPAPPPEIITSADDLLVLACPLPGRVAMPPTRSQMDVSRLSTHAQMDERVLKRQERMIKNRQAANMSRKKKKDQFLELEARTKHLETENGRLREENLHLQQRIQQLTAEVDMLRTTVPPASPPSSPRRPLLLCSVLLLATLNLAPIGTLFPFPLSESGAPASAPAPSGRTLLWAPSDDPAADLRHLTEAAHNASSCPKHVNQTEARRLSRVLHGWFDPSPLHPLNSSRPAGRGRPPCAGCPATPEPSLKRPVRRRPHPLRKRRSGRSALQLYRPSRYSRLLESIRRRDDTFYVVSFVGDHLMLPAISHNQTQRPRMSLLLPSPPLNESMRAPEHYVAMMQIDCEVVNTKLLHIHESAIPEPPVGNATGDRPNFNFPRPPLDGFPLDSALHWNDSGSEKRRDSADRKSPVRGAASPRATPNLAAAAANVTSDNWRKLRFGNRSLDVSGGDAAFGPAAPQDKARRSKQRRGDALSRQRSAEQDYFQSEH